MTNGKTTPVAEKTADPVVSTPVAENKPGDSVIATPVVETKESTTPVATPDTVKPAETIIPDVKPVELTRDFFVLLGNTAKSAESTTKLVKLGGIAISSSINQSDAEAMVRGEKSIVVRKFTPRVEIKKNGEITQISETNEDGTLTEDGLDRKSTIETYKEWYYNPPADSEYDDNEEKTLVQNGAILNVANLIHKFIVPSGNSDMICAMYILRAMEQWKESDKQLFESILKTVEIDGRSFKDIKLSDLIAGANERYNFLAKTVGISIVSEPSAKSDGAPRKRNRAAIAGMIGKSESNASPKSESKDKGLGSNAPTHKEFDPASITAAAKEGKPATIEVKPGDSSAPAKIASTVEKTDNENTVKPAESAKSESPAPIASDENKPAVESPKSESSTPAVEETKPAEKTDSK